MAFIGRPTKYNDELLAKAVDYLTEYPNNDEAIPTVVGLALYIGISKATIHRWKEEYPLIKDIADTVLEMQERALINGGLTSEYNSHVTKMLLAQHGYSDSQQIKSETTHKGEVTLAQRLTGGSRR